MRTTYKKVGKCPITHGECRLCTLYRGRHYYGLTACKEYLRRLHTRQSRLHSKKVTQDEKIRH